MKGYNDAIRYIAEGEVEADANGIGDGGEAEALAALTAHLFDVTVERVQADVAAASARIVREYEAEIERVQALPLRQRLAAQFGRAPTEDEVARAHIDAVYLGKPERYVEPECGDAGEWDSPGVRK